ncbi:TRAP transporter substrate-binding protein [Tranquillimonas alkanivorans]|uniref:TRAP-type mannitol/chloroaromatic compound transport system, substrate-binding protein n=1 Tax=Tranquillimonas alkanivorans TaxID=441119 RepID=A0A1I5N349_9RHOB|nr:TRAP transporter substrate-binding protein [Tranquillimonas alkanivorans]SFP16229.1 TRAP-type mannitol/chloroaromatic compound transport system, substrate-binding protein [Tranquillimonas alkanivorans]
MNLKTLFMGATAALALTAGAAAAQQTTLRIQTHHSPEAPSGQLAQEFVDNVEAMSDGEIDIEIFYSSAVVKSAEAFDAAASGILDCDMTNGSYQTGKNPAFQFVADVMGGYDTPLQFLSWITYGGGAEEINALYNAHGMEFVGAWVGGQESLNSTKPIAGIEDLKNFKFRSPPGMESEIFASLGAKPVVMDFTEIFTALETGIIDGADASSLANNVGLGIYDVAEYTTYPGFHSMSADHLACSSSVWDSLPDDQKQILKTAMNELALKTMMRVLVDNGEAKAMLPEKGVTLHDWSEEDRGQFRAAAKAAWDNWATKTPETESIVNSHKEFIERIGLGG